MPRTHSKKSPKNNPMLGREMLDWLAAEEGRGINDWCTEFKYKRDTLLKWANPNSRLYDEHFSKFYKAAVAIYDKVYDPSYAADIIEYAYRGWTMAMIAAEIGVSKETMLNWRKRHPEFGEAYAFAKVAQEASLDRAMMDFEADNEGKAASSYVSLLIKRHHNMCMSGDTFFNSSKAKETKVELSQSKENPIQIYLPDNGRNDEE